MSDHILPEANPIAGGPSAVHGDQHSGRLAQNALGLPGVLFCIVTGAAPIAAMLFNVPVTVLGGGFASPAAFLVATIVLTVFAVGYIEMARTRDGGGRLLLVRDPRLRADHGHGHRRADLASAT